jgi:hypothetical protein
MKTYARFFIVPVVFVGLGFFLHAQDGDKGRGKGKILLLKTGHAMEGDIEKVGTQFCVRRGKSEIWIAEDRAIQLCADWDDAYAYAQTQIKRDDANDRVKLARWCHMHRLTERALEQARAALELQPHNSDAKQIVTLLERALKEPPAKPATPAPAAPARPVESAPTVDVSFESLVAFSTKVQPILMNRCAACHAGASGGKFHLDRVAESGQRASTQRNLAAVLTYVDLDRPSISPFLLKAITPHGDAQIPPIKDRTAKPMQTMQQWVEQTVAKNPQLKDYHAKKQPPGSAQPKPKSVFPTQRSATPRQSDDVVSQPVPRLEIDEKNPPRVPPAEVTRPPMSVTPVDEFDPLHFNLRAHPHLFRQQVVSYR